MTILRFVLRFIFFVVGLAAILAMFSVALSFYRTYSESSTIVIAEGVPSIGRAPEDIDDVILSVVLQSRSDEINTPLSDDPSPVAFAIQPGESALSVGTRLEEMNLITDAELFRRYLSYNGLDVSIEAGDYDLRRNMNMAEIAQALQKAKFEEVAITIPEGLRAEEIAEKLSEEGIMGRRHLFGDGASWHRSRTPAFV